MMNRMNLRRVARHTKTRAAWLAFIALSCGGRTIAQESAGTAELPTIVVSGEQPGPGLWKVSSGDHVLWILGTLSPLPKNMHWQPKEVEAAIASADAVIDGPRVKVNADVGFFGKIALLGSMVGVRDNPDHKTLQQVVPPELYARWMTLKTKYFGAGRGRNIETWRPIFAAIELWNEAIKKAGLTREDVGDVVDSAVKARKIETVKPIYKIDVPDPRALVKEFKQSAMDDLDCFAKTLDRIDGDMDTIAARANAWATGDVAKLRTLPDSDQRQACLDAIASTKIAQERGITDLPQRVENTWIEAASVSLEKNRITFARLPITDLLAKDGYLAKLKAKGFTVEAPDEVVDSPDS
ncbi:MAG TPA: TraB/GumN family protein [Rhodanobacteraceae bacterium]